MPTPQQGEPDPALILRTLGVPDATVVARVHGGTDTAIWRVRRGDLDYALRLFRPEQSETAQRELAAMHAVASAGLPVPHVYTVGAWQERPAFLLGWLPGRPLLDAVRAQPRRTLALGLHFGRMQARIHTLPAPPAFLAQPDRWIEWAGPNEELLKAHLRALAPHASRLLHLDYHPLNVMTDGRRITGVLDWANARVGDPRADVARTYTILRMEPISPTPQPRITFFRWVLAQSWKRGYEQIAGPLEGMEPFYAWAGAVMLRDLAHRVNQPGGWLQPHHFDPLRRWIATQKRRAGIPVG